MKTDKIKQYKQNIKEFIKQRGFDEVLNKFPEFPAAVKKLDEATLSKINNVISSIQHINKMAINKQNKLKSPKEQIMRSICDSDVDLTQVTDEESALKLITERSSQEQINDLTDKYMNITDEEIAEEEKSMEKEALAILYFFPSMNSQQKKEVLRIILDRDILPYEHLYQNISMKIESICAAIKTLDLQEIKNEFEPKIPYFEKHLNHGNKYEQLKVIEHVIKEILKKTPHQ